MLPDQPSVTLLRTAIRRATHQILDTPVILNDPVALQVVPEACDPALVARLAKDGTADAPLLRSLFAMRSRFAEDRLAEAALGPGVRQYLMIAAGLDTSAWRQPDFAQPMLLFAADHPASLQFAQERFRACNLSRPPNLVHVPIDLERQHIGEQLSAHGFDVALPSFISMIGVAQYLTATAVDAVLQFASTLPKRSVDCGFVCCDRRPIEQQRPTGGSHVDGLYRIAR